MAYLAKLSAVPIPFSNRFVLYPDLNKFLIENIDGKNPAALYDLTQYKNGDEPASQTRLRIQRSVRQWAKQQGHDVDVHSREYSNNENFAIFWLTRGRTKRKRTRDPKEQTL